MKKQWISVKCGLSRDPKHRRQMGKAIWTYLHMLDLADWETGIVYDWKDENAAEDMGIDIRVLREDRRKLDDEGYITCRQKQYGQDITIHNWTNPREYTGEVYNQKQGDKKHPPSKTSQGDTQGDTQGSVKDVTPTLDSKNQISNCATHKPKANQIPEIALFRSVAKRYPNAVLFDDVVLSIQKVASRLNREVTADDLIPFYKRWCGLGYNPLNLAWLEWAEIGKIPENGRWQPSNTRYQEPKGIEAGRRFLERHGING